MDFMTAVNTCFLERYADFNGRSGRAEYWWFFLFNFVIAVVLNVLGAVAGIFAILAGLVSLALLIPSIAVAIRRMHDIGKSGWWVLIGLVPIIGFLVLIYFFVQEGEAKTNDWGPEPAPRG